MITLDLPRSTRWSLCSTGLMIPLAIAVLVRLAGAPGPIEAEEEPLLALPTLCDPTRLEDGCTDGLHCIAGTCEPLRRGSHGREGTACAGDLCEAGLECFHGRCTAWDRLPLAPEVCRAGPIQAALEYLRRRCAADLGQDDAPLTACTTKTWEPLSRGDSIFAGHIEALTHLLTVHFPSGEPGPRGRWLTPKMYAAYLEQFAPHHEALRNARALLVIGRASVEGPRELNQELSARRIALVERLLRATLGEATPPIHAWALADQATLSPEKFKRIEMRAVLSWDTDVTRRILDSTDLSKRTGPEWDSLLATITRNVLIVPLYCDGREFFPQPSFQGVLDPTKEPR